MCQKPKRIGNQRKLSTRKTLSRFKDDKRKPAQKTVPDKEAKRLKCWVEKDVQNRPDKDVESRKCQGQRFPRDRTVDNQNGKAMGKPNT